MDIARQHIETIRHDLLGGPSSDPNSRLFSVLTGALEIISKKVHHKDCHFLNELIQNFDDTGYEEVDEPTVKFTLTDTHFLAWSNENGFKREDVDSLCAIGRSSKASDLESTGENGIGFKSIFKVADQVTIKSHPYSFTFDTASELGQLGMLVPTWVDQPTGPKDGTLLTIRLKNQDGIRTALSDQLKNFDFYSLLFSRVLRKIKIVQVRGSFTTTEASFREHGESITELVIERSHGPRTIERFIIRNHSAESKTRVDTRKWPTNIRLAFPVVGENDKGPHQKRQQSCLTYAFQGIQDFGFSFMIHSDFILDASRSHVEPDQAWNIELESHISTSIVEALTWLARDAQSPIPLQWPFYLNCLEQVRDRYFQRITSKVKKMLCSLKLVRMDLETSAGVTRPFGRPREAIIVDNRFRQDGRPLLDHPDDLGTFVSSKYAPQALDSLKILGVYQMDYHYFSQRFAGMVNRDPTYIRTKSSRWHSVVATVLLRHPSYPQLKQVLKSSAIVPLNNGAWRVPTPENTFLPNKAAPPIPSGFSICTVASEASEDTSRRRLFEVLGLRKCDFSDVHKIILKKHQGSQFWSHAQLLEQAVYLFLTGYKPRNLPFTFINSRDIPISSELVFLSESRATSLRPLFEADLNISWLHEDYYSPPSIDAGLRVEWWSWLRQWKNILDDVPVISTNGQLSTAFKGLYDRCGSGKALDFLRQNSNLPLTNSTWCNNVGKLEVSTTDGPRKLCETALPILHEEAGGMVPLISLEPSDADWSFLKHFGVCVSVDRRFLFYQLSYLKANKHVTDPLASTRQIYYRLGKLIANDLEISKMRHGPYPLQFWNRD
ncbi:uncharacterized protein Z519_10696 [Cladophialophora bantiana CBS 173.52]|uniref:Sacsin/Nov domain-containing protein n=1 Tax=Cladophialophora bantiana (strain ATCC 10958 / CBS 173.52 / CDC B-1940 / NIH 8579) TaxID=1442370 RepID=A0A0D2HCL4_CLAB1|nr:uncharacterized protein Z519_10696 [Cladophialophora bantiana CBS 173.52]KIW88650.1 hypothetical protein Z519_10696 [Cladophialophora bantiana CBS 173.52]